MAAAELANEKRRHGDLATLWCPSSLALSTRGHLPRRLKQTQKSRNGIQTSEALPRLTTEARLKASSDSLIKKGGLFSPPFKMIIGCDRVNDSAQRSIDHHWNRRLVDDRHWSDHRHLADDRHWSDRHLVDDHRQSDHRQSLGDHRHHGSVDPVQGVISLSVSLGAAQLSFRRGHRF